MAHTSGRVRGLNFEGEVGRVVVVGLDGQEGRKDSPLFDGWWAVKKVTAIKAGESLQLVTFILFILLWTHFYRPCVTHEMIMPCLEYLPLSL